MVTILCLPFFSMSTTFFPEAKLRHHSSNGLFLPQTVVGSDSISNVRFDFFALGFAFFVTFCHLRTPFLFATIIQLLPSLPFLMAPILNNVALLDGAFLVGILYLYNMM
jgi:hypothetical protein